MVKRLLKMFLWLFFLFPGTAFSQQADAEMHRAVAVFEQTIRTMRDMKTRSENLGNTKMAVYLQKKIDLAEKYIGVKKQQIPLAAELQKIENALNEVELDASSGNTEAIHKEQNLRRKRQQVLDEYARLQSEANALLVEFSTIKP